jgi:hypothetical protein
MLRALRSSADEDNDYSLERGWSVTRIGSLYRGNIRQLPHGTLHRPRVTETKTVTIGDRYA